MNVGTQRERAHTVELGATLYPGSYSYARDDDCPLPKKEASIAGGDFLGDLFCNTASQPSKEAMEEASRIQLISKWTPEEVGVWLNCVNFGEYRQAFMTNDIGGVELLNLPANKETDFHFRIEFDVHRRL